MNSNDGQVPRDGDGVRGRVREEVFRLNPYSPGKPIEELQRELGLKEVVKLASNENACGPSNLALEALAAAMAGVNRYPDGSCYVLKERLSHKLQVGADQLVIGNGSDGLLKLLAETFLSPKDRQVMAFPSFVQYEFAGALLGAQTVKVPLDADLCLDLEAMAAQVTPDTKLVYVCNPNNPTGTAVSREAAARFLERLPNGPIVVFDEAYVEYADPWVADGLEFLRRGYPVIVLRTFSKVYGLAGLRIGYGISTPEIIGYITRTREPFQVNRLAEAAAAAALDDIEHVENCRQVNTDGRQFLYEGFARLGLRYVPSQGNFILLAVPGKGTDHFENILKEGVIIRPGEPIGVPGFIRVTVGTRRENELLLAALEKSLVLHGQTLAGSGFVG